MPASPRLLLACPRGDGPRFIDQGWWISITVRDDGGLPIAGVPASDFWLVDCDPLRNAVLCGGSTSSNADSATNVAGMTTMSLTTMAAGGCADGMALVVQGVLIGDPEAGCAIKCVDIRLRSPDMNGSLVVDLVDLSLFAQAYPPHAYQECADLDLNDSVNLADLARFVMHYDIPNHEC